MNIGYVVAIFEGHATYHLWVIENISAIQLCIADIFSTYSIANLNTQQEYSATMSITHFHQVQNKTNITLLFLGDETYYY